ncbi:hypothetical protein AS593_04235 [Caulobacter vibrioides]|nr:hypothetical protein AS593_04235 [Caulobacter vibrioides]
MTKSASLEIHQINVSQGDCTLVLNRDQAKLKAIVEDRAKNASNANDRALATDVLNSDPLNYLPYCIHAKLSLKDTVKAALLVDAGNDGYGPDVRAYLLKVGAIVPGLYQPQLSLLATHYHDDHQDGLRSLMRDPMDPNKLKLAKQAAAQVGAGHVETTVEAVRPARFFRPAPHDKTVDPKAFRDRSTGLFPAMLAELNNQPTSYTTGQIPKTSVLPIPMGGTNGLQRSVIHLGVDAASQPIDVFVLASDQAYAVDGRTKEDIPNKNPKKGRPSSENDRSVVLMVQYGSFRHFLGGDIGGSTCTIEADVEGKLATVLPTMLPLIPNYRATTAPSHCCSTKLSHHGSRHSNTDQLLRVLQPKVALASTGFRQYFHGHPTAENINRMKPGATWAGQNPTAMGTTLSHILATEIASVGKGKAFDPDTGLNVKVMGDIVLRPVDETVRPRLTTTGTWDSRVTLQIYGSGDFSWVDPSDSRYALRAGEPTPTAGAPGFPIYPIAPFETVCDGH